MLSVDLVNTNEVSGEIRGLSGEHLGFFREVNSPTWYSEFRLGPLEDPGAGVFLVEPGVYGASAVVNNAPIYTEQMFSDFRTALRWVIDNLPDSERLWAALQVRNTWPVTQRMLGVSSTAVRWVTDESACRISNREQWAVYQVDGSDLLVAHGLVGEPPTEERLRCGGVAACLAAGKRKLGELFGLDLTEVMAVPFSSVFF